MYVQMGDYTILEVLRETDLSYILGEEGTEIFLHKKQTTKELEVGDKVEVEVFRGQEKVQLETVLEKAPTPQLPPVPVVEPGLHEAGLP